MKTKLLSVFLVLAMLLTSVLCLLPAAAETDYDAEAKTKGYVCRVGTAEEAAKNDYAGYYKFFSAADKGYDNSKNALEVVAAGGKNDQTITLINTVNVENQVSNGQTTKFLHGSVAIPKERTLVIDGNGQTYNSKWSFRADGGNLTVKNLKFVMVSGGGETFGDVRANSTLTYENCTFNTAGAYDRTGDGAFIFVGGGSSKMNLKGCTVRVGKDGKWLNSTEDVKDSSGNVTGQVAVVRSMFVAYVNDTTLNLDGTDIDISQNSNLRGFSIGRGVLNINNSTLKVADDKNPAANVTVSNSTLESVGSANLFNYDGFGAEINVKVLNSKLTSAKYVFGLTKCQSAVNISLEGTTVVNGAKRAMSITNNLQAVNVTAKDTVEIRSDAGEGNAIYVCGNNENASFTLTMMDQSKLISAKNVMSFAHGSAPITKATISFLDRVTVQAENGYLLDSHERPVTYIISDKATISVTDEEPIKNTKEGRLTTSTVYAPVMEKGASVRTVEGSKGIRFTSTMKKVTDTDAVKLTATYGTLIVKAADLEGKEFTIDALTKAGVTFANIVATDAGTVAGENETTYNAALVNLPDDQLDTNFAARAYAVYTINGVEHYVYSDFNATDNCRSMSQIASRAQADTQPTKSAAYPNEIAAGVYSPYTKAQYAVISEYVKKN